MSGEPYRRDTPPEGGDIHTRLKNITFATPLVDRNKCANFLFSLSFEIADVRWSGIEVNLRGLVEKSDGRNI